MTRVVLDANVFVSGAIQKGASYRIVQRWLGAGDFEVVMCPELLAEVTEVLTERPRLRKWIDLTVAREYVGTIHTRRPRCRPNGYRSGDSRCG